MGCCCSSETPDTVDGKNVEILNTTSFSCKEYLSLNCNCKVKVDSSVPSDTNNSTYNIVSFLVYYRWLL